MAETIQQLIDRNQKNGLTPKQIIDGFKATYGRDITEFDANDDYDAFKSSFEAQKQTASVKSAIDSVASVFDEKKTPKTEAKDSVMSAVNVYKSAQPTSTFSSSRKTDIPELTDSLDRLDRKIAKITKPEAKVTVPLLQELAKASNDLGLMYTSDKDLQKLPDLVRPESPLETKERERLNIPTADVGPSVEKTVAYGQGLAKEFVMAAKDAGYGLLKESADYVSNVAGFESFATGHQSDVSKAFELPRLKNESRSKALYDQFGRDIEEVSKDRKGDHPLVRAGEGFVTVTKGVKDALVGMATMINDYGGINVRAGESRSDESVRKGAEVFAGLAGTSTGVVLNFLKQPLETLEAKPIETLMTLLPFYEAALPLAKSFPGAARFVDGMSVAMDAVVRNKPVQAVKNVVEAGLEKANRPFTAVKRKVGEGFATTESMGSAVAEQVYRTPEASTTTIKNLGSKLSDASEGVETVKPETVMVKHESPNGLPPVSIMTKVEHILDDGTIDKVKTETTNLFEKLDEAHLAAYKSDIKAHELVPENATPEWTAVYHQKYEGLSRLYADDLQRTGKGKADDLLQSNINDYIKDEYAGNDPFFIEVVTGDEKGFIKHWSEAIKKQVEADNIQNEITANLTDTVVMPKTASSHGIEPVSGKIMKGRELYKKVIENPEMTGVERAGAQRSGGESADVTHVLREDPELSQSYIVDDAKFKKFNDTVKEIHDAVVDMDPTRTNPLLTREQLGARLGQIIDQTITGGLGLLQDAKFKKLVTERFKEALDNSSLTKDAKLRALRDFQHDVIGSGKNISEGKVESFNITDPNGNVIFDIEHIRNVVVDVANAKVVSSAKKLAIKNLIDDIAIDAESNATKQRIIKESERLATMVKDENGKLKLPDPDVYIKEMLERVINGKETPAIFSPIDSKTLSNIVSDNKRTLIDELKKSKNPLPDNVILKKLDEQIKRFDSMKKVDIEGVDVWAKADVADAMYWEEKSKNSFKDPTGFAAFAQAMKRNRTARNLGSLKNNDLSLNAMLSLKTGNPFISYFVFKDGFLDYTAPREVIRAKDPLKARAYDAIDRSSLVDTTQLIKDLGGAHKPGSQVANLIKVVTSDEYLASLQASGNKAVNLARYLGGKLGEGWDWSMTKLETNYSKWGDVPYKIQQALETYKKLDRSIKILVDGKNALGKQFFVESQISKNARLHLEKNASGEIVADILDNRGVKVPGFDTVVGTIESPKISQLLGRAAAYEANKLIFDYSDVPTWNKKVRASPWLNAHSSFYTFNSLTLDIPFLKRGTVANTFFPAEYVSSNMPSIIRRNMVTAAGQSLRKTFLIHGVMGYIRQGEGDENRRTLVRGVKSALGFSPKNADTIVLAPLIDPANIYMNDWSGVVPFDLTDTLAKGGASLLLAVAGHHDHKSAEDSFMPKFSKAMKDKKKEQSEALQMGDFQKAMDIQKEIVKESKYTGLFLKDIRGELWTADDALKLVGLTGGMLKDAFEYVADVKESGKTFNIKTFGDKMIPGIIGGTPYSIFAGIGGVIGENISPQQSKEKEATLIESTGEFLRTYGPQGRETQKYGKEVDGEVPDVMPAAMFFISQAIGAGWKKINLLDSKEKVATGGESTISDKYSLYLGGVGKELSANLLRPLESQIADANRLSRKTNDPFEKKRLDSRKIDMQLRYDNIKNAINIFLEKEKENVEKLFSKKKNTDEEKVEEIDYLPDSYK